MAQLETETQHKVKLSFTSKSKKTSSSKHLRQQSIHNFRAADAHNAQHITTNTNDLFIKQASKEVVIPCIKDNKWKPIRQPSTDPPLLESDTQNHKDQTAEINEQQQEALDLILDHANNKDIDAIPLPLAPQKNPNSAFHQMQRNRVPGIAEVRHPRKKLEIDCAQRPNIPDICEYDEMPISMFGAALLKGMGWEKEKPVGNPYGVNGHLQIPKAVSVKPRPKNLGFGAVLTKEEAELLVQRKFNPKRQRTERDKKRIAEIESWTEREPAIKKQKIEKMEDVKVKVKKKRRRERIKWIRNGLRVRCIKNGKYFRQKGIVNDVIDEFRVCVQMSDDLLLTLYADEVETVIPKKGALVVVLRGKYKKERGCILTKNKKEQIASVQLEDNLSIIQCDYDDICAI